MICLFATKNNFIVHRLALWDMSFFLSYDSEKEGVNTDNHVD